jgi:hypothetical protein
MRAMPAAHSPLPEDAFTVLLEAARAGDVTAMGRLLEGARAHLYRAARERIPEELIPRMAPSDAVQCAFLEAQQHFKSFHCGSEAEFCGWLSAILTTP